MRLDCDDDASNLLHAVLGWVVGFLLDHTFSLDRLGPVLLEYAFVYPFLPRPRERLCKHTTDPDTSAHFFCDPLGHLLADAYLSCID